MVIKMKSIPLAKTLRMLIVLKKKSNNKYLLQTPKSVRGLAIIFKNINRQKQ